MRLLIALSDRLADRLADWLADRLNLLAHTAEAPCASATKIAAHHATAEALIPKPQVLIPS